MIEFIEDICENVGSKTVTLTDKNKGAYVLNKKQRDVLEAAGFSPGEGGANATNIVLETANDPVTSKLEVSYYKSIRKGTGRIPEPRMGRDIIRWMQVGDLLNIANIGSTLFIWKSTSDQLPLNEFISSAATRIDQNSVLRKARGISGKPPRQNKEIFDFRRNGAVVAGAIVRSQSKCEMPQCERETFQRKDGTIYLEVHHILPLAEGGDDTMINAAALCPTCHRELHYGDRRLALRNKLSNAIKAKEEQRKGE